MHFQFSWINDAGEAQVFRTDCPDMGEFMMRSHADFPKRHTDIQEQFDRIYGAEKGKFEALLISASADVQSAEVKTGIQGLSIVITRAAHQMIDLVDRPNNYA